MPDWAPVPNLPSVQATVASAQPAHLTGVDHIEPDGFGKGFTSVMNIRKIAGQMELWKLIQQATDDKGTIHWDKYNASAAKDKDTDLALVAPDYVPIVREVQNKQLTAADDIANQQGALNVLVKKGLLNPSDAQKIQQGIEARAGASGSMVGSGGSSPASNPESVINADNNTMLKHLATIDTGQYIDMMTQNPNNKIQHYISGKTLSPTDQANIATQFVKTQSSKNNDLTTTTNQLHATPKGVVTMNPVGITKESQETRSNIYAKTLGDSNKKLADFNVNQNNLLNAISLAYKSENETSKTPELARFAQLVGMNVKDNETMPMLESKYLAQVEKNLNDSGNNNSVAALEMAKKALGENAPYKVMALAAMAEYENEIANALKYATAQNTHDYNGYDQIYNKQILPNIMHYARAIAYRKLNKFDPKAATAWGDTLYSIHGKQFGSTLNNSINAINAAIKNPQDRRIYNIANSMGYPMQ